MDVFDPRLDILPLAQQILWPDLRPALELGFVLYGGTAIALRLGHRVSIDFDFFRETPLDHEELQRTFPFLAKAIPIQTQADTLSVLVPVGQETIKMSFFGPIRFGRTGVPQLTKDGVMQVASLDDLLATKLKVILQRVEAKDYKDIAALLKSDVDLARGLAAAQTMFSPTFQPAESLKTMVYFEGGDLESLHQDEKNILINAVRQVRELPDVEIISSRLKI